MPSPTLSASTNSPLLHPNPVPRISLFGLYLPSSHDLEKTLPGPSTSRHSPSSSISSISSLGGGAAAKGLRRRRTLTQTLGALALLTLLATWSGTISLPLPGRWQVASASNSHDGVADPASKIDDTDPSLSSSTPHHPHRPDITPLTPLQAWGLDLRGDQFIAGLEPWPSNEPVNQSEAPLSSLGHQADEVYDWGYLDLQNCTAQLEEFASIALPSSISRTIVQHLSHFLGPAPSGEAWDSIRRVWQTAKDTSLDSTKEVKTWRDGKAAEESWSWELFTDEEANDYVKQMLGGSRLEMMWDALPSGILRSDTLRYLLMLLEGGIYSDTDTTLLKKPSEWGGDPTIWKFGEGWLDESLQRRLASGEAADAVLGKPSVIVGIEADVGTRADWAKWWPRPIQIAQWTMASAPFHPISLSAVLRILHRTAQAVDWAHEHERIVKILNDQGRYDEAKAVRDATVMNEPSHGGPLGVMAWTGPGIWTDAVMSYLRVKYGMVWTDLRNLHKPLRVGDVVILPVTGFSPGVGNFGSQGPFHAQAMVEHGFKGSWKTDEHPR